MKSPSNKNSDQSPGIRCQLKNRLFFISTLAFLSTLILDKPLLASQDLFSIVPAGDAAYGELKQLAQAGWLSNKDVAPSTLTRFEVAELIVKAEKNSGEIVVAQNTSASDDTLLPPPENIQAGTAATPTGPVTLTPAQKAATREEAVKSLHSLEEAYQYELKKVKDQVKDAEAKGGPPMPRSVVWCLKSTDKEQVFGSPSRALARLAVSAPSNPPKVLVVEGPPMIVVPAVSGWSSFMPRS